MFTLCPKCALTLIVTAADLRAGQGYVRCGRCSNVFNALVSLSDEREGPPQTPRPQVPDAPVEESTPLEAASAEEASTPIEASSPVESAASIEAATSLEVSTSLEASARIEAAGEDVVSEPETPATPIFERVPEATDEIPDKALEFNPESSNASQVFVEPEHGVAQAIGTGTFKMLVLRNKDLARTLGLDDDEEEGAETTLEASGEHAEVSDSLRKEVSAATESSASTLEWLQGRTPEEIVPPRVRRLWSAGAAVLVLVLGAQIINHYRDDLAAVPAIAPGLSGIYGALGVELHPDWDLGAYDVRQLGAATDTTDTSALRLRASIANRAARAQPLPLLRVTMQDRFGNPIAARDVTPSVYANASQARFLGAGERLDAQIVFHDPGRNAVGFELDACLPSRGERIVCALGQKPR